MAKKKKCPECPAGEKWAVPYADFLSLLLALFIALYAISATNTEKVKALKEEFIKIFDYSPRAEQMQPVVTLIPELKEDTEIIQTQQTREQFEQQNHEMSAEVVKRGGILEQVEEGVVLKLPTNLLFPLDSATLEDQEAKLFFKRLTQIVQRLPKNIKIDVRGFAQNPNVANTRFQDDYQLASARALYVMKNLIKNGISPEQIFFSSQGQYGPTIKSKIQNDQIAQKNRVEIYFFVNEQQSKKAKKILSEIMQ